MAAKGQWIDGAQGLCLGWWKHFIQYYNGKYKALNINQNPENFTACTVILKHEN